MTHLNQMNQLKQITRPPKVDKVTHDPLSFDEQTD